jgi:hypothetical protein
MRNQTDYYRGRGNSCIARPVGHRGWRLLKGIFGVRFLTFSQGVLDSAIRNFSIYP